MEIRRPHLSYTRGSLKIGGISAKTLAGRYGTPLYVTDLDRVSRRCDQATSAITKEYPNSLLAFATKSNSTLEVVAALVRRGAGATIVSLAGLRLIRASGVDPRNVVFDGPSKSVEELAGAIEAGIGMINAESTQEVDDIERLCSKLGVKSCRVGFRVNLDIRADTHAGLATGSRESKFGVPREEVVQYCRKRYPGLKRVKLVGLHCHIGSQVNNFVTFRQMTEEMVRLADEMERYGIVKIEEFNFGGGLGFAYSDEKVLDFRDYAEATAGRFATLRGRDRSREARLVFELGRSIVADSTVLITRVNYLKTAGRTQWALVDAGMNDFLRPALYGAYHEIVTADVRHTARADVAYSIGGPVCESTDAFGTDRRFGVKLTRGDLIAILDTGAYGTSMASQYNMRPLPLTVLVSRGKSRLAKQNFFPAPRLPLVRDA